MEGSCRCGSGMPFQQRVYGRMGTIIGLLGARKIVWYFRQRSFYRRWLIVVLDEKFVSGACIQLLHRLNGLEIRCHICRR